MKRYARIYVQFLKQYLKTLLEYKEINDANRNGKKWYKNYLNRKYRRKDKQFFKRVEDESDEEI